ncbi:TetR/AcrR family transcriptional regulator [Nocardia farcinica]|uniref:TetR/AcrR family transcriptional regulator n=1 Tax=Nocardia TaxID=1817 RepID=UPI000BF1BDA2|nr:MULTISPECIES: TetR/AcrR family transcriptional regulator [Nocardia]MBF6072816.1 TetR/AcrR family transcriptional regulator [Nocardia farcinica]MBF6253839.1 TetR/AcrR family transcriptional regulator [Nocardia farcinica]MBF6265350.1 TetR/AcrR family transcriptional regulator [Nocardia farcinica]MBF6271021.1 TetR/AcrR family transcriptional regulator [Nocardia farcinica]MBF6283950.1 TetR/AcrR family transcriptional regulator [Nocardia farcinica]
MPKLWSETIDTHRRTVRDSILDTAARLAIEHGVASMTMSGIAEQAGIGRATLYKYFPDVSAILAAWHERQVGHHLEQLVAVSDTESDPSRRLDALLGAYARILRESRHRHDSDLGAMVRHSGPHVDHAEQRLRQLVTEAVAAAAATGTVRTDTPADELAIYCLHALDAAVAASSDAAVARLITVIRAGLGPA